MIASTTIAAARRTPDDEAPTGRLNLLKKPLAKDTPRLIGRILKRIRGRHLNVIPLACYPGQERHKEAQAQDQYSPAQEPERRTAGGK
jgi:hypothetical protein